MGLLQFQRESVARKVAGVDPVLAAGSPLPTGTSLLWVVRHLSRAEAMWVVSRFAGSSEPIPTGAPRLDDTPEAALAEYRETWARVDEIVRRAESLAELTRDTGDESPVNLRWVLMHLLEETARHAGHADILRELLDGSTGR